MQLILNGKRVGLALAEIREILELYDKGDENAAQNAKALRKFRERIVAFERKREDIDHAIDELRTACARLEDLLAKSRPDLLPGAGEHDTPVRARADGLQEARPH